MILGAPAGLPAPRALTAARRGFVHPESWGHDCRHFLQGFQQGTDSLSPGSVATVFSEAPEFITILGRSNWVPKQNKPRAPMGEGDEPRGSPQPQRQRQAECAEKELLWSKTATGDGH